MTIQDKQNRIIRQFELLGDWQERYKYIIKLGQKLPPLEEEHKTDDNLVRGCQSQVWLKTDLKENRIQFHADSDAAITKGLVALLVNVYSDEAPDEILNEEPVFIKKIGMEKHLSPTRSNGLASMVRQMKIYAMAYKSKMEQHSSAK